MAKIIEINGKKYEAVKDEFLHPDIACDFCDLEELCLKNKGEFCEDDNGNMNVHFKLLNE